MGGSLHNPPDLPPFLKGGFRGIRKAYPFWMDFRGGLKGIQIIWVGHQPSSVCTGWKAFATGFLMFYGSPNLIRA